MRWTRFTALVVTLVGCASGDDPSSAVDAGSVVGIDARAAAVTCADDPCFAGVDCIDTTAGFECGACPAGTEGDGQSCTEIDGCADSPCFGEVTCTDVEAPGTGFVCGACPTGTEGDGETCTDIDGCADSPCAEGVTCLDIAAPGTGFACGTCPAGTEGNGESCTDINGCAGGPCHPGVTCTDVLAPGDGYTCGPCPLGTVGDGETCEASCQPHLDIGCGSSISSTTTGVGSRDVVDDWACSPYDLTGREIVFRFVAPSTGIATASLSGLTADLDLLVIKAVAASCNADDSLACITGGYSGSSGTTPELVRWDAVAGTAYYLVVDGYDGATSSFVLQVGTSVVDVLLNEINGGVVDYVELRNHGACSVNLSNFSIRHEPDCSDTIDFTFPATTLAAGGVFRAVESGVTLGANEVGIPGESICDFVDGTGSTALCVGPCDTSTCANVIDYVTRDFDAGDSFDPVGLACVDFSPAPFDTSVVASDQAMRRAAFGGGAPTFFSSDWVAGPASRD